MTQVDFGIITTRADEFAAILQRFPARVQKHASGRAYGICQIPTKSGNHCVVALGRCSEQNTSAAQQQIANEMISDLKPRMLLVVGIAGGVPSDDFTLGDVIISTRIDNFSVRKRYEDSPEKLDIRSGIHLVTSDIAAKLRSEDVTGWNNETSIMLDRPKVDQSQFNADKFKEKIAAKDTASWYNKLQASIKKHFSSTRPPLFAAGTIASSSSLIRNTDLLVKWLQNTRKENFREIDGTQHEQLHDALLSAFPTRQDLEIMVLDQLNVNLSAIVSDGNPAHIAFELIGWSMAHGRLEELINAALKQNPQNPQLINVAKQLILAVEMATAGVYQATRRTQPQYPVMAICGISDIIGLDRDNQWTKYACQTAAAFAYAFVTAEIITSRVTSEIPRTTSNVTSTTLSSSLPTPDKLIARLGQLLGNKQTDSTERINVFISYSEDDEQFKEQIDRHLAPLKRHGIIRLLYNQQAEAGQKWEKETASYIYSAQIILLLMSPSFIASEWIYHKEITYMIKRQEAGDAVRVIPVLLHSVETLAETPFQKLVSLPRNGCPIDTWRDSDKAWADVAVEIRWFCDRLRQSEGKRQKR